MVEVVAWAWLFVPLWVVVSVWVGGDAAKHSSHNPFLWGLSVFVGGPLGFLLYLNLGRDECGEPHAETDGHPTSDGLTACPNCQSLEDVTRERCRVCGASM